MEVRNASVQLGAVTMHYTTCGTGPVVTLMHPVGLNGMVWEGQFEALARHFQVLAPDLRGHGGSNGGDRPFTLDDLAGDVIGLWDALGVEESHLVGLSLGGMVAQGIALQAPRRVRSLVLVNTTGTLNDDGRAAMKGRAAVARSAGMAGIVPPTLERWFTPESMATGAPSVGRTRETLLAADPIAYAYTWEAIAGLDYLGRLSQVVNPTLVTVGEKDLSTPPRMAGALVQTIPGARLVVVPGGAHMFPVETPGALTPLLLSFLR